MILRYGKLQYFTTQQTTETSYIVHDIKIWQDAIYILHHTTRQNDKVIRKYQKNANKFFRRQLQIPLAWKLWSIRLIRVASQTASLVTPLQVYQVSKISWNPCKLLHFVFQENSSINVISMLQSSNEVSKMETKRQSKFSEKDVS